MAVSLRPNSYSLFPAFEVVKILLYFEATSVELL